MKVDGTATMGQPAHDDLVTADYLLSVNAYILACFGRTAGNHQTKADQCTCILGPAGLDRQFSQIYIIALDYHLLARWIINELWVDMRKSAQLRQLVYRLAQAGRQCRGFQQGKLLANFTQIMDVIEADGLCYSTRTAKQVAKYRHHAVARGLK